MSDQHSNLIMTVRSSRTAQPVVVRKQSRLAPAIQKISHPRLRHRLHISASRLELSMALLVDRARPASLRLFDQIPMNPDDHVRQIKLITPYLANQAVAFVGDSDGASILLCLLNKHPDWRPNRILLLDFDQRLLNVARDIAERFGFSHILETQLYNVFDALPPYLVGQFDWYYTNPPYGSHNQGASARLFITRGCELVRPCGKACIILPHDDERAWTRDVMLMTQRFLCQHGWVTSEKINELHRYRLDDDQNLTSSLMIVQRDAAHITQPMPYAGRRVKFDEIPLFYGRNVLPPYPRYIRSNNLQDFDWSEVKVASNE